jgi:transcriptional regulator with XRE-family HTH domain
MDDLTPTVLADKADISVPYASQLLSRKRTPSREMALHVYQRTGLRLSFLSSMSDRDIATLVRLEAKAA